MSIIVVLVLVGGALLYLRIAAGVFFTSQTHRLQTIETLEDARQMESEEGVALRVLPSGEWLIGHAVSGHVPGALDAAVICASDGTVYTSTEHFCDGDYELQAFLDFLEGDDLEEIGLAKKHDGIQVFEVR